MYYAVLYIYLLCEFSYSRIRTETHSGNKMLLYLRRHETCENVRVLQDELIKKKLIEQYVNTRFHSLFFPANRLLR